MKLFLIIIFEIKFFSIHKNKDKIKFYINKIPQMTVYLF